MMVIDDRTRVRYTFYRGHGAPGKTDTLDIFSVHGFPVGLIQCESNFLGIMDPGRNMCIGSGGWANIIEKFKKAKAYCDHPFEVSHHGRSKKIVPIHGEWIGDHLNGGDSAPARMVDFELGGAL
jgi:hypothetical protein